MPVSSLKSKILAGAAALTLGASAAFAQAVTLDTATGPVELPAVPENIAVLDVAALDTITALGVTPAGVVDRLYLPEFENAVPDAARIGTFFEPDYEKLAAMRPDLIVMGGRALRNADALQRLGTAVDMNIGNDAVTDGVARMHAYAALFGKEAEADALEAELNEKIAAARAAVEETGGRALVILTNGPKVSAYGPGSRFGWMHDALDWEAASPDIEENASHGEPISFEFIADVNPDTILVIDRATAIADGAQNAQATLDNALVQGTNAWQSGRVVYLPAVPSYISGGGIQSLMMIFDEITRQLTEAKGA